MLTIELSRGEASLGSAAIRTVDDRDVSGVTDPEIRSLVDAVIARMPWAGVGRDAGGLVLDTPSTTALNRMLAEVLTPRGVAWQVIQD